MKKIILALLILCCCQDVKQNNCPDVDIKFSPKGGITQSMVDAIGDAKTNINILAFSFTSRPIAQALTDAHKRNVKINIVVDKENLNNKNSVINLLDSHKINIYIDDKHAIAHNKIIIIDNRKVFTGSFNFSKAAEESNAENSIVISDIKTAEIYIENWSLHKDHSYLYIQD